MRAVRVHQPGGAPSVDEVEDVPGGGDVEVAVEAFTLNPVDVNVARGLFYGGTPSLPYVVGVEAVGRDDGGRRVYVNGPGIGIGRDGVWAERVRVPASAVHEVPGDASDELALASGVAGMAGWMPVVWRADVRADDRVLVLGATGTAGGVAVQAAKLRGAFVVGAGRRTQALNELDVDGVVDLDGDLDARFRDAFGGEGPTVVIDLLWGEPLAAALRAAAQGARVVNVGQSAGAAATITSNSVRGKQAVIYGYSNYALPPDVFAHGYRQLVEHAAAGRVGFRALETHALSELQDVWNRELAGPGAKLVVRF